MKLDEFRKSDMTLSISDQNAIGLEIFNRRRKVGKCTSVCKLNKHS